ncbi:hypothetical protein B7R22_15365 [Subtercola boreus]|uniref:Uncharacterized protein n=2 Tax=Subtercola boreus TaxID=120213 RepID=A0A3E0VUI1_9MICO|nr:hypothetical protein B7R22_15365 [Subtercola boreus]
MPPGLNRRAAYGLRLCRKGTAIFLLVIVVLLSASVALPAGLFLPIGMLVGLACALAVAALLGVASMVLGVQAVRLAERLGGLGAAINAVVSGVFTLGLAAAALVAALGAFAAR